MILPLLTMVIVLKAKNRSFTFVASSEALARIFFMYAKIYHKSSPLAKKSNAHIKQILRQCNIFRLKYFLSKTQKSKKKNSTLPNE